VFMGEEVLLDVQGVREWVLRIGRVGVVVKDDNGKGMVGSDICVRWLVGMFLLHVEVYLS
jgi:U3 small nucleolar RNA-associated protein 20